VGGTVQHLHQTNILSAATATGVGNGGLSSNRIQVSPVHVFHSVRWLYGAAMLYNRVMTGTEARTNKNYFKPGDGQNDNIAKSGRQCQTNAWNQTTRSQTLPAAPPQLAMIGI